MGGDFAPEATILGSLLARNELQADQHIVFVGDRQEIQRMADHLQAFISPFEIAHTPHQVAMGDSPIRSFATHPEACIYLGQKMVRSGELDGFCSAATLCSRRQKPSIN
jgi:glycerol-3-phosphate acyltransferase PlsX